MSFRYQIDPVTDRVLCLIDCANAVNADRSEIDGVLDPSMKTRCC